MPTFDIIDESEITPQQDKAIRHALCIAFPHDEPVYSHTRAWHQSIPAFSVLAFHNGAAIAHAAVVDRVVDAGGVPVRVAGVQNVFVLPEQRGAKLSGQALAVAMAEASRRGCDTGLLFCTHNLERLYASFGWIPLSPRRITRVEDGKELPLPAKSLTMYLPLRMTSFPDGSLHLCGNDW